MSEYFKCDFPDCNQTADRWSHESHVKWCRVTLAVEADADSEAFMDFCTFDHMAGWALIEIAKKDSLK